MRRLLLIAVAALLVVTVAWTSSGGWAVVKVAKIPDAWVVGKPLQLQWQVRQHGVHPTEGLRPTLEARSGARVVTGTAGPFTEDGETGYRGRITFPAAGDWQVTIRTGWGDLKTVLVPWRVVDSVTPVRGTVEEHLASRGIARFSDVERGRRLFVSQGCVTCHVHRDVPVKADDAPNRGMLVNLGPDLSDRRFPAEYLVSFLKDPSIKPPTDPNKRMPNLALREKEIIPLVAFLNAERRAASR